MRCSIVNIIVKCFLAKIHFITIFLASASAAEGGYLCSIIIFSINSVISILEPNFSFGPFAELLY